MVGLKLKGLNFKYDIWFDMLIVVVDNKDEIVVCVVVNGVNFVFNCVGEYLIFVLEIIICVDVVELFDIILGEDYGLSVDVLVNEIEVNGSNLIFVSLVCDDEILMYFNFNLYYSEIEMLCYIKCLENKDLVFNYLMILLGLCMMKFNVIVEMILIIWFEFVNLYLFCLFD